MQIVVSTLIGLCLWIILWAFDVKALDGFLLAIAIILSATVAWMAGPYVRRLIRPDTD
jgi:predicted PurR-regulated permease PerM